MNPDIALRLASALATKNEKLNDLRVIVDACPLAMFVTNDQGACLYVNDAYRFLVGRNSSDVEGDGWKQFVHPEDIDKVSFFWAASMSNASTFDQDFRLLRPDGSSVPVHCTAVKLPTSGHVGYVNATDGANCRFICQARARNTRSEKISA